MSLFDGSYRGKVTVMSVGLLPKELWFLTTVHTDRGNDEFGMTNGVSLIALASAP